MWTSQGSSILSQYFAKIKNPSSFPEVFQVLLWCLFLPIQKVFFLFLSIHFILCQPSPAYHITNPFYNSPHFSGLLQTTGLPEIGSLCVCVLEDGLASSLLHAYHSKGPRPIAVWTCGRTLKRKHASVWWKWTDIPSREAKEKKGWGKRANRLCKSGVIPSAERTGHVTFQA